MFDASRAKMITDKVNEPDTRIREFMISKSLHKALVEAEKVARNGKYGFLFKCEKLNFGERKVLAKEIKKLGFYTKPWEHLAYVEICWL